MAEISMRERFDTKVRRRGPDECWPWGAGCFGTGYGQFSVNGRSTKAHRVAYELAKGPIPSELIVRHTCDNRCCVYPAHLLLGTYKDNTADRRERGRTFNLAKTECVNGHPFSGANLYTRPDGYRSCRACQKRRDATYYRRRTGQLETRPSA